MRASPATTDLGGPWSGVGAATVMELVLEAARDRPGEPVLVFEDGLELTCTQLRDEAERFAGYLRDHARTGDRVAIAMGNRAEYMIATVAAMAARMTLVPVNPALRPHDAEHLLRDSGASLAVVDEENRKLIDDLRDSCPDLERVVHLAGAEPSSLPAGSAPLPLDESAARDDIVAVYYTSGTTGLPKGCMVDHEWALRVVDAFQRVFHHQRGDRMLSCLQFCYADPTLLLFDMLACGGTLVAMRSFSVSRFWPVVRRLGVTIVFTIETIPVWLLKHEPSSDDRDHSVRFAIHAGIPPDIHRQLEERFGFPWYEDYAMMESNVITLMRPAEAAPMVGSGSVGRPIPEVELRVVDDDGVEVAPGEVGELVMRGPGMFRGYFGNPEATAEMVRDGWLFTGDLGRLDENGFAFFAGRKKHVIRRSGQNVGAAEVEEVLMLHPDVEEAAVVPQPDSDVGEEVHAHVRACEGAALEPAQLLTFAGERLAAFKVPRYVAVWERDFPRTPSMRVQKRELRHVGPVWDRTAGAWIKMFDGKGPEG